MKKFYVVYKTTNLVNNKIYIGKKMDFDLDDDYFGAGKQLLKDIEIYGKDKFKKEILYVFDNFKKSTIMEKKIVNKEFLSRPDVYNLNTGGNGGWFYINKLRDTDPSIRVEISRLGGKASGRKNGLLCKKEKKGIFDPKFINQKGIKNTQYGTKWIYNKKLNQVKKIHKNQLKKYLNNGWQLGRKIKC